MFFASSEHDVTTTSQPDPAAFSPARRRGIDPGVRLTEIRERYVDRGRPLPAAIERALQADPRRGAQLILAAVERRRHARRAEGQRLRKMLRFEQDLWTTGLLRVAGVDEAG